MFKTVLVGLMTFFLVSGFFIGIGYMFEIQSLMFSFYEETPTGFTAGGSVLSFIIGLICSFVVGNFYQRKVSH
ncbi:hypothetical protein [Alkalihalobacterium sp. APHAB7]|uniref:hypothetical protein n=1 Tax=Alkalihalobacterium sp. APHAB7 TaxID=3402081 RepID=UPI003AAE8426